MNGITGPGTVVVTAARLALGLLTAAVFVGEVILLTSAQSFAQSYPEFAHLAAPLGAAAIAFGVCVVMVLTITGVLVGFIRDDRIFGLLSLRLVDVLISAIVSAAVIVTVVLVSIPGPPFLAVVLLSGALTGVALTLVLVMLRSLLRKAAAMRVELDEVV